MNGPARVGHAPGVAPSAIRLSGIRRTFGPVVAVDLVDLEVAAGEILALLGPSGCGKTTLLRMIAGLDRADAGTIDISGRRVHGPGIDIPPERRQVGMVFQDLALFPHLSVAENVGYAVAREPLHARDVKVAELLDLVGLSDAGRWRPHELSGGMQQRVALARALAGRPEVILLDEPFASLDLALRTQLRGDLQRVLDITGTTALFVTHDQADALTIADRVAVMRRGRIDQVARPEQVYALPATPFVATFIGVSNLVPGRVSDGYAETALGRHRVSMSTAAGRALVLVRPEHCDLVPEGHHEGEIAGLPGEVIARRFAGSELLFEIEPDADGPRLWVEAGSHARELSVGARVRVVLRAEDTVAFRTEPSDPFPAAQLAIRGSAARGD